MRKRKGIRLNKKVSPDTDNTLGKQPTIRRYLVSDVSGQMGVQGCPVDRVAREDFWNDEWAESVACGKFIGRITTHMPVDVHSPDPAFNEPGYLTSLRTGIADKQYSLMMEKAATYIHSASLGTGLLPTESEGMANVLLNMVHPEQWKEQSDAAKLLAFGSE